MYMNLSVHIYYVSTYLFPGCMNLVNSQYIAHTDSIKHTTKSNFIYSFYIINTIRLNFWKCKAG